MRRILSILGTALLLTVLVGCAQKSAPTEEPVMESETAPTVKSEPEAKTQSATENEALLDLVRVMDDTLEACPEYNTFVWLDDAVHAMNCLDAPNRTTLELAREIGSLTGKSYEAVLIEKNEDTRYFRQRMDYVSIEDADGVHNRNTQEICERMQGARTQLAQIYDSYDVVVQEVASLGTQDAMVTELMGYVNETVLVGFEKLVSGDGKQVFLFPGDFDVRKCRKEDLTIQRWESQTTAEVSAYERDIVDTAISRFLEASFYLPGYQALFADTLTRELDSFSDSAISVQDFKTLVSWKTTTYISDGITQESFEQRMQDVRNTFDYAQKSLFVNGEGIACEVTYDYAEPPAVIELSKEPYWSLFTRQMQAVFESAAQGIEQTLSLYVTQSPAITPEAFVQSMLYGEDDGGEETRYRVFMDYELFYGPQTTEQLQAVLDGYRQELRQRVYETFGGEYDQAYLETVLAEAGAELDTWLAEKTQPADMETE